MIVIIAFYILTQGGSKVLGWPLKGVVASGYGPRAAPVAGASTFHNGIDIDPENMKDTVKAPINGIVKSMYFSPSGGLSMLIEHPISKNRVWQTGYADMAAYYPGIKVGDKVKKGQSIGWPGMSGPSTGVHLHFTLENPEGSKVDPEKYIGKALT